MAEASSNDRTLLKILNGVQMGAEVALTSGEYSLGSGPADDLQLTDVSLKPGHARLRLAPGKIEIRAGSGALSTSRGQTLGPDADGWTELEPLEIIAAGTVRFALGPPTAQWTTLADAPSGTETPARKPTPLPAATPAARYVTAAASLAFFLLGGLVVYMVLHGASGGAATAAADPRAQFTEIRAILDSYPFGRPIKLRQEVDGEIFAAGYVQTPAERRALMAAVSKTSAPVKFRLEVLASLRAQIDDLVRAEKAKLSYKLSPEGVLTLEGLILDEEQERRFVERVRGAVIGLAQVESNIVTARKLLAEIEKLGKTSRLDPFVLFRLDRQVVEASGALPTEKIDLWVGFLQAYSKRFAADIGLRSLVRLQNPDGSTPEEPPRDRAVVVGPMPNALDVQRLAEGRYQLNDIFATKPPSQNVARAPAPPAQPTLRPLPLAPSRPAPDALAAVLQPLGTGAPAPSVPPAPDRTALPAAQTSPVLAFAPAPPAATGSPAPAAEALKPTFLNGSPTVTGAAVVPVASAGAAPRSTDSQRPIDPTSPKDPSRPIDPPSAAAPPAPPAASGTAASSPAAGACVAGADRRGLDACIAANAESPSVSAIKSAGPSADLMKGAYDFLKSLAVAGAKPAAKAKPAGEPAPLPSAPAALTATPAPAPPPPPAPAETPTLRAAPSSPTTPAAAREPERPAPQGPERWLPLLTDASRADRTAACAPGSRLTLANIVGALVWLDLLSVGQSPPLETMDVEQQGLILAAALNPSLARDCLRRAERRFNGARVESLYLQEVDINPAFIHYIADGLTPYPLEVTGADVAARYLQLRDGRRLVEGAAPDGATRLAIVGELGAAIRAPNSYSIVIYAQTINWLVR